MEPTLFSVLWIDDRRRPISLDALSRIAQRARRDAWARKVCSL